jgi:hypothetical protein
VCVAHIGNFRLAGQKAQMLPHLASYLFSLAPHFVVETAWSSIIQTTISRTTARYSTAMGKCGSPLLLMWCRN